MGVYKRKYKAKDEQGNTVIKESENWSIVYHVNGKKKRETLGTDYKQALAILRKTQTEIVEGKYLDIKKPKVRILFNQLADRFMDWSENNSKHRTYLNHRTYIESLKDNFGEFYIDDITPEMIEVYKTKLKNTMIENAKKNTDRKKKDGQTVNRYLSCMKTMFNMVINKRIFNDDIKIDDNPVSRVEKYKEPDSRNRILSDEETLSLMRVIEYPEFKNIRPIILTGYHTGIRKSRILNLKWENVNLQGIGYIVVTETKTNKNRTINLNPTLKNILTDVKLNYSINGIKNPEGYVFLNPKTNKPYKDIRKPQLLLFKKAKIKGFTFHSFRHNFGSTLSYGGADITNIKELMGHADITTTQRYLHGTQGAKREAVKLMETREMNGHITDTIGKNDHFKTSKKLTHSDDKRRA